MARGGLMNRTGWRNGPHCCGESRASGSFPFDRSRVRMTMGTDNGNSRSLRDDNQKNKQQQPQIPTTVDPYGMTTKRISNNNRRFQRQPQVLRLRRSRNARTASFRMTGLGYA